MKRIYVIRHCEAEGQLAEAKLTNKGLQQALALSDFLSDIKVDRIITSPYLRAVQSVQQLAENLHVEIKKNNKLTERVLSTKNFSDWLEKLNRTFDDMDLKFEGGESSREAMERVVEVVEEIFNDKYENTILVTHGNLMSLLLRHFNGDFGFEDWKKLRNPDVFLISKAGDKVTCEHLWR